MCIRDSFTTNCLMPVKPSYGDRVFTTSVVAYPGMVHIGDGKDFSPVIKKALELGGYDRDVAMTGINGGTTLTTGFGHEAILASAGAVIEGEMCIRDRAKGLPVGSNQSGTAEGFSGLCL